MCMKPYEKHWKPLRWFDFGDVLSAFGNIIVQMLSQLHYW